MKRGLPSMMFAFSLAVMLFCVMAEAKVSIGSVIYRNHAEALNGSGVTFSILLFNMHEKSPVNLIVVPKSYPEGWMVSANPGEIQLPYTVPENHVTPEPGYEYVSLPGSGGTIKVKPVSVNVDIPASAEPGEYPITMEAVATGSGGSLSSSQTRDFVFMVKVGGNASTGEENGENEATGNDTFMAGMKNKSMQEEIINSGNPSEDSKGNASGFPLSLTGVIALLLWSVVIIMYVRRWMRT
jgi:hypothetical protein